LHLAIYRF